jgi:hypothetical protein
MESPASLLDKWKRNQIFEAIKVAGLDPREFDLEDHDGKVRIKSKLSTSCFVIGGEVGHYVGQRTVGDGPDFPFEVYSWYGVAERFGWWIREVKADLATPDLWAELRREIELVGANSEDFAENTAFSLGEQKEIAARLQELAGDVRRAVSLSEAQIRLLDAKLDYLAKAAGRLGRIDWRNAFVGAIAGFILVAALPPESARALIFGFLRVIGHFYGLPELPGGD